MKQRTWWKTGMAGVWAIALGTVVVHVATGWRYGFNRDELMLLEDARHLAWGYVQYPPMTAFFGWMALNLFGTSLVGFRFFAAVVQAVALVLTGMMAKEIGATVAGGEWRVARETKKNQDQGSKNAPGAPSGEGLLNSETAARNSKSEIRENAKGRSALCGKGSLRASGQVERTGQDSEFGEWAAVVAAGAGVPFCLGGGALMQYISFDYACWVLVAYGMVRLLRPACRDDKKTQDPGSESEPGAISEGEKRRSKIENKAAEKWWVVVGIGIGLGMLAKWTMGFLAVGVVVGVLATETRRFLRSGWLWLGVAAAMVVWGPNLWWQWKRDFPSLEFLRFLHTRDVSTGVTDGFLVGQLELTLLAFPLALAGLWFYFFAEEGKRYRTLGWMYAVPLVLLAVMQGRDYYLAPAYPMLYAAGALWIEEKARNAKFESRNSQEKPTVEKWNRRAGRIARWSRKWLPAMLVLDVVVAGCIALPIMPVKSRWWNMAAQVDTVLPEELGWEELTETVAKARDALPEGERVRAGILARNYGEMGALNLYGGRYGLPRAISGVNSSWERGYGDPPPQTVIAVGYSREFLEQHFASCELVGHPWNRYGVATEETIEDPDIFVCRGLKESWEEFWKKLKLFA